MTLLTKQKSIITPLFALLAAYVFMSCKKADTQETAKVERVVAETPVDTGAEPVPAQDIIADAKPQWIYYKAVPITAPNASSTFTCDDAKYSSLNIVFKGDSVFVGGKYTDDVYRGNVKAKSYFEQQYLYNFYKDMLKREFNLALGDSFEQVRNKKAGDKSSPLNAYFNDAFFIKDYMFAEAGGCVYVYRQNPSYKAASPAKKDKAATTANGFVTLPFDSEAYYSACVYPGDTKTCSSKYPSHNFGKDNFYKAVLAAYDNMEPTIYFKIPNQDVQLYLIQFQGDNGDQYGLLSMKDGKVIQTLTVGTTGDDIMEFVIDKKQVSLYKNQNKAKGKAFAVYTISPKGTFIKK